MNLSFVIDMNFSPVWVEFLSALGWSSDHWSSVGDPRAEDDEIMEWSRLNRRAVFTRDLDFATALALTQAPERAARLVGSVQASREVLGTPLTHGERSDHAHTMTILRESLSVETFAAEWEAGRAMAMEQAVACALEEDES